ILLMVLAAPALAQDPAFTYATEEDKKDAPSDVVWKASAQAGLLITAGNARVTAVSAGLTASRRQGKNRLQLEGSAAYARSSIFLAADADGSGTISADEVTRPATTTNKGWATNGRYDRFLTDSGSLYAAALAAADEPAGKEFFGGGQAGYSRRLFNINSHTLLAEVGYDYSYENPVL